MPHGLRHSHVDHTVCHATTDYRPGAQIQDLPKELVCQVMNMDLLAALWYRIVQLGMLEIRELIFVRRLMRMAHSLGRRILRTMYIWRSWRRSHHKQRQKSGYHCIVASPHLKSSVQRVGIAIPPYAGMVSCYRVDLHTDQIWGFLLQRLVTILVPTHQHINNYYHEYHICMQPNVNMIVGVHHPTLTCPRYHSPSWENSSPYTCEYNGTSCISCGYIWSK